jgi:D-alanine--poly(phosphoribitol) ligase subunit 2
MDDVTRIVLDEVQKDKSLKTASLEGENWQNLQLLGKMAATDSAGLVNLIFAVEDRILTELGVSIEISSERAVSLTRSPFRTVGTLADFVSQLVVEAKKGPE